MSAKRSCALFAVVCMLVVILAGCSKRKTAKTTQMEAIEALGKLPGLRQTHDPQLKAELARLIAEHATPEQLQQQTRKHGSSTLDTPEQVAAELNRILPQHDLEAVLLRIDRFYPSGEFRFDPVALRQALDVEQLFARQRHEYVALFERPSFQFRVNLMRGLLADQSFIEHAKLAQRLLAFTVADSLAAGTPAATVFPLRQMLVMIHKLAQTPSLAARLAAARLRGDTLEIVRAVVSHPHCSQPTATAIWKILDGQLAGWVPDRETWIGDRALGLHCYEMVRDGRLLSLLTEEEIHTLKKKKRYVAFIAAVTKSVDNDEQLYLEIMRKVIAACKRPYYSRTDVFKRIRQQLNDLQNTPRYPLFAARVLIPGIEPGQHAQAVDRAHCEAWAIALAKSLGRKMAGDRRNPLTGKPYDIQRGEDTITLDVIDSQDTDYRVQVPTRWWSETNGS